MAFILPGPYTLIHLVLSVLLIVVDATCSSSVARLCFLFCFTMVIDKMINQNVKFFSFQYFLLNKKILIC